MKMELKRIYPENKKSVNECCELLIQCFKHSWDTMEEAMETMDYCFEEDGIVIVAVDAQENNRDEKVLGFIGARVKYEPNGWELHPLAVGEKFQRKGVGTFLIQALEMEVAAQGGHVLYLGTDDEDGATSLSQGDLFENTFEKIKNIKNLDNHPYEFYQKNGFQIVGVLPDVNGYGKPDIYMAKRIL
jgi:GNAT superfamily N-acetyltransferase